MLRVKFYVIVVILLSTVIANAAFLPKLLHLHNSNVGVAPPPIETALELLDTIEMLDTVELR